jgi:hypothetical protein
MAPWQSLVIEEEVDVHLVGHSAEATKIRHISVFRRNVDECIRASKCDISPNDRIRHNNPAPGLPSYPTVRDLGDTFDEVGITLVKWCSELHKTADVLIADQDYGNSRAEY